MHHLREQLLALVERITDEEARLKAEGKQFRACQDQIQNLPGVLLKFLCDLWP